jgi:hypothetical protein
MSIGPSEPDARTRLREEQAAEAAALNAVQRAQRARVKHRERLADADRSVAQAVVELVRVSGASRAARLTDESVSAVRQMARDAGLTRGQIQ